MSETFKKLQKYNYWDGKNLNVGFKRSNYLEKITQYVGNSLVKVFVGQRRSGKSYLLRQIISQLATQGINPKNIFYLNKEMVDFDEIKDYKQFYSLLKLYKKTLNIKGKVYLLVDEIQEVEGWEKIVNSLSQNYKEQYEIFITGSNSRMLSSELATYLSGRYVTFEIYPFSFLEYISYKKMPKNKESFIEYLKSGGLPELFHLPEEEIKAHYVSSLKDTVMLKDIVQRYNIKDSQLLEDVFKFISGNIGNLFSINSLVNYLKSNGVKTNHETISNYIIYLTQSFLIHCAERYDIKGKEIFSGSKKYYLNDLSFKNYLSSGFNFGIGKHLENIIYLHYRSLGYIVYVGSIQGEEVDFVIEKGDEKKYVQVTYSLSDRKVANREFRALEKINDSFEKIVISLDEISLGNKNGIRHFCAWDLK